MDTSQRQWQTTIWIGKENPDSKTFYGDTFRSLRQAVREWLTEQKPRFFYSATVECVYSEELRSANLPPSPGEKKWYIQNRIGYYPFDSSPREFETALEE